MPGFSKNHHRSRTRQTFPASRYNDPRGGRPSALERNILRYRAVEATLYLFYADEVRDFMMSNIYPLAKRAPDAPFWEPLEEQRLTGVLSRVLMDAETRKLVTPADAGALRETLVSEYQQGPSLKIAFAHVIKIGIFSETSANELQGLIKYRNDIAHRIHLLMADVTRSSWTSDVLSFTVPHYKGEALDRLRRYARSLERRARGKIALYLSMNRSLFEMAERVYEDELVRLDRKIRKLVDNEQARTAAISAELDLTGTELVGDLAPGFFYNRRPSRTYRDDYIPPTGHLTARGAEICYRLFDLGRSPLAVAYLMGDHPTIRRTPTRQLAQGRGTGPRPAARDSLRHDDRQAACPCDVIREDAFIPRRTSCQGAPTRPAADLPNRR